MRILRRLLVLLRRQLTDDASYYVASLLLVAILLLSLTLFSFLSPHIFLLPILHVLVVLPLLVVAILFAFGFLQARAEGRAGLADTLHTRASAIPIALARVLSGLLFALTVGAVLTVGLAGAVLNRLLPWPPSLYLGGVIDLLAATLGIGLVAYCLGHIIGSGMRSRKSVLLILPLVPLVVSLMAAKGLGEPILLVVLPLAGALMLYLTMAATHVRLTGVIVMPVVLTLFLIPLYWLRYSSDLLVALVTARTSEEPSIHRYHDFQPKHKKTYRMTPFVVTARTGSGDFPLNFRLQPHFLLESIGILEYFRSKEPDRSSIPSQHEYGGVRYEGQMGLLTYRGRGELHYAGPEGVDNLPSQRLGRFESPVICRMRLGDTVVFNRGDRCFYDIDFTGREVHDRPCLEENTFEPIDVIGSKLIDRTCSIGCVGESYEEESDGILLPVFGKSGAVGVVDMRGHRFIPDAGRLPRPKTLFGWGSPRPRDCFDYCAGAIVSLPEREYAGLMTASLARQGGPLTIALFDKDGELLAEDTPDLCISALVMPCLMKYLVESLHPPVLTLTSFFMAYRFDAGASHRALFLMPNSMVAMQRDRAAGTAVQVLRAVLLMVPALALAIFLSWRVRYRSRMLGLSRCAREAWGTVALAFGLAGYIAFRLLHPQGLSELCQNCGNARLIDVNGCSHCGAPWSKGKPGGPTWRICDSQRRAGVSGLEEDYLGPVLRSR